jgi:zinc transport system substrate-binding protein
MTKQGNVMNNGRIRKKLVLFIILFFSIVYLTSCSSEKRIKNVNHKLKIYVSILPQKYFVEKIGGPLVDVYVLVSPGQNPHTYEPTPKQMSSLADTDIYFTIGVTFENIWLDKIASVNPRLKIVSTYEGIKRRTIEGHSHEDETGSSGEAHDEHSQNLDPHIWLDPNLVISQAKTIADALIQYSHGNKPLLEKNLILFVQEMKGLDKSIREELKDIKTKNFLVFHPTWGYFADEYGLEQISIEKEGKEPSARHLAEIIELAKKKNIKIIFVQMQLSRTYAESIAKAIGAKVISVDPLSADYTNNLLKITKIMAENLK